MRRLVILVLALLLMLTTACDPVLDEEAATAVNAYRTANGLPALVRDSNLDRQAGWQVARMAHRGMIFHSTDPTRGLAPGWQIVGENVAAGGTVASVQAALERSEPHRKNLLEPRFRKFGLSAVRKDGIVYLVQLFTG